MQAEDVFSATKGSNNFYIDSIKPGETAENTINLSFHNRQNRDFLVTAAARRHRTDNRDTATGSYDLTIKVAYEYEDMSQADTEKGGVTEELPVKLQAVENSRPALQNLALGYGW